MQSDLLTPDIKPPSCASPSLVGSPHGCAADSDCERGSVRSGSKGSSDRKISQKSTGGRESVFTQSMAFVRKTTLVKSNNAGLIRSSAINSTSAAGRARSICRLKGSVFPQASSVAVPCAIIAGAIKLGIDRHDIALWGSNSPLNDPGAWSGFTFLLGFLIVFRTSQAYGRFWEGCTASHTMRTEWFDACSAVVAFCKHSKESIGKIQQFQSLLVRLFSLLHAVALSEMEDSGNSEDIEAFTFSIIDAGGIDAETLDAVMNSEAKVELVFQWIQCLIVDNIGTGVLDIPAPILTRSFQELANGMIAFQACIKISTIPFPYPYSQACDCVLIMHWLLAPLVISQWVNQWFWASIFTFIQVFVLWSLNFIAQEIENPFGIDQNDLNGKQMQIEMNKHLLQLLSPEARRTPELSDRAVSDSFPSAHISNGMRTSCDRSLLDVWNQVQGITQLHRSSTHELETHAGKSVGIMPDDSVSVSSAGSRASLNNCRHMPESPWEFASVGTEPVYISSPIWPTFLAVSDEARAVVTLGGFPATVNGHDRSWLNDRFVREDLAEYSVHGRETYWSTSGRLFIYRDASAGSWMVASAAALQSARDGHGPCWAKTAANVDILDPHLLAAFTQVHDGERGYQHVIGAGVVLLELPAGKSPCPGRSGRVGQRLAASGAKTVTDRRKAFDRGSARASGAKTVTDTQERRASAPPRGSMGMDFADVVNRVTVA